MIWSKVGLGSHAFPSTICPRDRCPAMRSETWVDSFASKIPHNENFRTQFIKILKISPSKTSLKDGYHHIYTPAGGYLPNFAILFLFSKSSFWYGFYLKNENEKFLFYLKYKENMCGSWFASQFTPPIPPPTNQPNAEIWHINVSVPKTKRWIIQIKNFHFFYQKNKTKQNKT